MNELDGTGVEQVQAMKALVVAFDQVGARLRTGRPAAVLEAIPPAALESVASARWASVTVLRHGRFTTAAETHEQARQADLMQYELGSGPCVDAILDDSMYCPADLAHDDRWPAYAQRVESELGVRSMMSFRLGLAETDQSIAGLNLYSDQPHAFDEADQWTGLLLATHAAALVNAAANAERADHLSVALESNRDIGAAVGIVMANHHLTKAAAISVLKVASQDTNRKLAALAADVVASGGLTLSPRAAGPRR
jgi:GAF domain-containing protein